MDSAAEACFCFEQKEEVESVFDSELVLEVGACLQVVVAAAVGAGAYLQVVVAVAVEAVTCLQVVVAAAVGAGAYLQVVVVVAVEAEA